MMTRWIAIIYLALLGFIIVLADSGAKLFLVWRQIPYGDKIGHFFLIGTAAFVLNLALDCRVFKVWRIKILLGSVIVLSVATLEELSQHFIDSRACSFGDLMADYLGILVLGTLAMLAKSKRVATSSS